MIHVFLSQLLLPGGGMGGELLDVDGCVGRKFVEDRLGSLREGALRVVVLEFFVESLRVEDARLVIH